MKVMTKLCLALIFAMMIPAFANAATLHYWRMEGNLDDSVGSAADAGGAGSHEFVSDTMYNPLTGPVANSQSVSSKDSKFEARYITTPLSGGGDFTVECFYRKQSSLDNENLSVVYQYDGANLNWKIQAMQDANGKLAFTWVVENRWHQQGGEIKSEYKFDLQTWYHLAGTYDSSTGTAALYVNYASEGTLTDADLKNVGEGNNVRIGMGWGEKRTNYIDEVRISDTVLTTSQMLVPEPATVGLLLVGGIGILVRRKRRI